jgi:hypothetical protein
MNEIVFGSGGLLLAALNIRQAFQIRGLRKRTKNLEAALCFHQHSYFGPAGLHGKWSTTSEQRDTGAASQKIFEQQAAQKLADKERRNT